MKQLCWMRKMYWLNNKLTCVFLREGRLNIYLPDILIFHVKGDNHDNDSYWGLHQYYLPHLSNFPISPCKRITHVPTFKLCSFSLYTSPSCHVYKIDSLSCYFLNYDLCKYKIEDLISCQ